jgi:hypothetical protein
MKTQKQRVGSIVDLHPAKKYIISKISDDSIFKKGVRSGCFFRVFEQRRKETFRKGIKDKPCCKIYVIDKRNDTSLNKPFSDSNYGSCFQMLHQHWIDEGKVVISEK